MRTDIQLLRGVAVLAVMFAHFGALMPGGFLGVDMFFVISGYVITLSLIKLWGQEAEPGRMLRKFWKRRFWRLFPALSVTLTATLICAFFLLPADDFRDQMEMTVWSFFFAGNIGVEVVSRQDYFDPGTEFNWLLHLWSLGVEEQFYLVFPFLMFFLFSRLKASSSPQFVTGAVLLGSVFSFLLAGVNDIEAVAFGSQRLTDITGVSAALGYYSPLTRAWQFGVGIIAALLSTKARNNQRRPFLPLAGAGLLTLSFLITPESNLLPGPLTLVPMVAMFVLIRYPLSKRVTDSALSMPIRWLGDRSYSAYLWHWPVWSVLTQFFSDGIAVIIAAFGTTLVLSALTYRYIERPLINRYRSTEAGKRAPASPRPRRHLGFGAVLAMPLLLSGIIFGTESGLRDSGAIGQREPVARIDPILDCLQTSCEGQRIDVLLIGDSHAGALANTLSASLAEEGLSMRGAIMVGCLHLPSERISSADVECVSLSKRVREILLDLEPTYVVVFGYTAGRFTTINSGGDQVVELIDTTTGRMVSEENGSNAYRIGLEEVVDIVERAHSHLYVISGTPDFVLRPESAGRNGEPISLADTFLSAYSGQQFGQVTRRDNQAFRHDPFRLIEQDLARKSASVSWIDSWESVCGSDTCRQVDDTGVLLFSDQDHLSEFGAHLLANSIVQEIAEQAR